MSEEATEEKKNDIKLVTTTTTLKTNCTIRINTFNVVDLWLKQSKKKRMNEEKRVVTTHKNQPQNIL